MGEIADDHVDAIFESYGEPLQPEDDPLFRPIQMHRYSSPTPFLRSTDIATGPSLTERVKKSERYKTRGACESRADWEQRQKTKTLPKEAHAYCPKDGALALSEVDEEGFCTLCHNLAEQPPSA